MSEGQNVKQNGKFEWKSNVEFFPSMSADGRFIICKHVITTIKPVTYFEKVMQGKSDKPAVAKAPAETN